MIKRKILGAALLMASAQVSVAKDVITLIVPTEPGGGTDTLFRAIAREAEPHLGATIVIQNLGGAGGAIGVSRLARAKPDGLTVAGVWMGPITTAPHTIKTTYSPEDYRPVVNLDSAPYVMCVRSDFPANSGKEFLEELKANPEKYTYGTDGMAGPAHLASERIFGEFGIKARDIPYRGAGETMPAMVGGVVDIYVGSVPPAMALEQSGKIKCLLSTGAKKIEALPNMTSLDEVGVGDKELLLWHGLIAPAGTPDAEIQRLEDAFAKAAESPEMAKFFKTVGVEKDVKRSDEFSKHINTEYEELGLQIKELGLQQNG